MEQQLTTLEEQPKEMQSITVLLEKQVKLQKYTLIVLSVLTISIVLLVVVLLSFLPKIDSLLTVASSSMDSINTVAKSLESADMAGMMQKVNSIDIEGLNQAISDLQSAVAPFAKLFGR